MRSLFTLMSTVSFFLLAFHLQGQNEWEPTGPANITIHSLAVKMPYLFAGANCNEGGIFLTDDYGDSWDQVNQGLPQDQAPIRSIAINDTSFIVGATYRGMYMATDATEIWQKIPNGNAVYSIAFASAPWDAIVVAGSKIKGTSAVIISYDGINWNDISGGLPVEGALYSILVRDTSLFVSTGHGVYRYNIHSSQWKPSNIGMTNAFVDALAQHESYLYAGTNEKGVFISEDGSTWTEKNNGLQIDDTEFTSFAFSGTGIFAAASGDHGGVFQSNDNGDTWHEINTGFPAGVNINALAVNGLYLYAGSDSNGVYRRELSSLVSTHDLDEDFAGSHLLIYPNPGSGNFNLSFSSDPASAEFKNIEVICYTPLGQSIFIKGYKLVNGELNTDLDISNFPEGMYLLQIRNQNKSVFRKIIIHK
ncbi:MAG TPA: T9SS type A sorting domain-containing protein [Saprospiraceae bacterium]|nr:T9SS type A sorting domain-containing protein [Saprospiraceae bacterium]